MNSSVIYKYIIYFMSIIKFQNSKIPRGCRRLEGDMWGLRVVKFASQCRVVQTHLHRASRFFALEFWNFGISTGYPQAKLLILKAFSAFQGGLTNWNWVGTENGNWNFVRTKYGQNDGC